MGRPPDDGRSTPGCANQERRHPLRGLSFRRPGTTCSTPAPPASPVTDTSPANPVLLAKSPGFPRPGEEMLNASTCTARGALLREAAVAACCRTAHHHVIRILPHVRRCDACERR